MPDAMPNLKAIFHAALEFPSAEERDAYLKGVCGENAELRREVESLLEANLEADGFLSRVVPAITATLDMPPVTETVGSVIGPYKLIEQIGEGGMGVVYVAQQEKPVRRKVALKIIKPGMDTKQVIARFEAERQALAMMDHPNIAKVLDVGATGEARNAERGVRSEEDTNSSTPHSELRAPNSPLPAPHSSGRPYFVMELVRGLPITEYCDKKTLNTRERLELFIKVCRAVQHAHQKGIIHRDLKPSNILVTIMEDGPVPKVIDFGGWPKFLNLGDVVARG